MKGNKFKDLIITERVDCYCEKSIISVLTTFSNKSLTQNLYFFCFTNMNTRQGNPFFKINVEKYSNKLSMKALVEKDILMKKQG